MTAMGGGPEVPTKYSPSSQKELLLCALPWPEKDAQKGIAGFKEAFPDIEVHYIYTSFRNGQINSIDIDPELIKRATYLATLFWMPPNAEAIPHAKLIQFFSAGINPIAKHPIYTDSKIPLCSANGIHGPQIAEWVIMMDLVHSHRFPRLYDLQKQKQWNQREGLAVSDRVGKRVGILGYGSIGRQVARVAKAMGMDVVAYTASPRQTEESKRDTGYIVPGTGDPEGKFPSKWFSGTKKEDVHRFLAQEIDLLVLAVPLTEATTHLLSTEEFELLHKSNPQGTYVANIARGQVIDQPALVKALHEGLIKGAALDVADPEPLPEDDPLWSAPNVLITPHVSGSTDVYADRGFDLVKENVQRERDGKKLINEVNRKRGY